MLVQTDSQPAFTSTLLRYESSPLSSFGCLRPPIIIRLFHKRTLLEKSSSATSVISLFAVHWVHLLVCVVVQSDLQRISAEIRQVEGYWSEHFLNQFSILLLHWGDFYPQTGQYHYGYVLTLLQLILICFEHLAHLVLHCQLCCVYVRYFIFFQRDRYFKTLFLEVLHRA